MIELYYKTKFLSLFYDVKYDVTVYDVPTTMLPFTMNDVPVYDVNIFPRPYGSLLYIGLWIVFLG